MSDKVPPLEEGLVQAMKALDNQIEREVGRRTPAELEVQGVQKWEPYSKRIENVTSLVLNCFADEDVKLDSILVLSQSYVKALRMIIEELGEEGLGKLRTGYCRGTLEALARDMYQAEQMLKEVGGLN